MAQNKADKNKIFTLASVCFLTAGGAQLTITKVILYHLTGPGSVMFNHYNSSVRQGLSFASDREK